VVASRAKRRAESTCSKRVIFSSLRSLADLPRCYARGKEGVNQRTVRNKKEKIRVVIISRLAKYYAHVGCTAANGKRLKWFALATD
jgi:hypothetical protein